MDLVEEGDDERLSETVRLLLQITREKVDGGDGDGALAAVLHAIRLTRGEGAILGILDDAKRRAEMRYDREVSRQTDVARDMVKNLLKQDTILMESGDQDLLRQAFEDGSSVVCRKCDALVSVARWEAHRDLWCGALDEREAEDEETDS